MALPATSVWEVRPTNGSNTNGGGFDSAGTGTDFSIQNAKNTVGNNISTTDAVANGTTTITSATASFTSAITGNIVFFSGGSGSITAQWRRATFVSSTSITIDTSIASSTGMTMNIGGALATIVQANTNSVQGNSTWVKAEATILVTSKITINFTGATTNQWPAIIGYTTTRGDNGKVTIKANSNFGDRIVDLSSSGCAFCNFILDLNSNSATRGILVTSNGCHLHNVSVKNSVGISIELQQNDTMASYCDVTASTLTGNPQIIAGVNAGRPTTLLYCTVTGGTSVGIGLGPSGQAIGCIAGNNTGASSDGFQVTLNQGTNVLVGNTSYANGRDGFRLTSSGYEGVVILNNLSYGNSAFGFNYTNGALPTSFFFMDRSAYGGNTSGNLNNITAGTNDVSLSGDPTVAGASNNFALNNTAGAGASCRAAGFPGTLTVGGTGYRDIGALQHQDSPATTTVVIASTQNLFIQES